MADIIEMNNVNEVSNISEANEMNKDKEINYETLNVVDREIPYSKVVDFIEFVRVNSYGKQDGRFHEYLMDYSEAVAILTMYTDCDTYNFKFDDVMKFIQSEKWAKIKEELGDTYIYFHYYVKNEIEYLNTPLRFADEAMAKFMETMNAINKIINAVDIEALKNYDFNKIIEAVDMIENVSTQDK